MFVENAYCDIFNASDFQIKKTILKQLFLWLEAWYPELLSISTIAPVLLTFGFIGLCVLGFFYMVLHFGRWHWITYEVRKESIVQYLPLVVLKSVFKGEFEILFLELSRWYIMRTIGIIPLIKDSDF